MTHRLSWKAAVLLLTAVLPLAAQTKPSASPPPESAPAPMVATNGALPEHKITPNDLLLISVFEEPEYNRQIRVGTDGMISLPRLKSGVHVEGLLPREVEDEIRRQLISQEILLHPIVGVSITEYAQRTISVVGNVKSPGQISISSATPLLVALAKAGWITPEAGSTLTLTRSDTEATQTISIDQLLASSSDPAVNVLLTGGEVITVPVAPKVWVTGNVAHSQPVAIKNPGDASVYKILSTVEGLTQYYGKTAYIYRIDPKATTTGGRREIAIPLKDMMHRKAPDVALVADDILLIPDDNGTKRRAILAELASLGGVVTSSAVVIGLR